MTCRIAIAGAAGRMGRTLLQAAGPDFSIVGGTERAGSDLLGTPIAAPRAMDGALYSNSVEAAAHQADVWIDFTAPAATMAALRSLNDTPVRAAVIGTTGFSPEEESAIAAQARRIAIVKAGNFSLGVNLLLALVEQAAAKLGPDWDIEISETHHRRKVDAPSGTALMLGEAAAAGRGAAKLADIDTPPYFGATGPREPGRIGLAVSRAGGVIGDHEVRFASESEILSLGHRALDRGIFAAGALHAAAWAADREPGLYSMRHVLGL